MTNSRDRENGGLEMDRRGVERNSPLQQERNVMRKKWFESHNFKAEKVVPTGGEVGLYIGPLKAGTYLFFDDFHEDQTKGTLIAK
jgi:hypothetical protein